MLFFDVPQSLFYLHTLIVVCVLGAGGGEKRGEILGKWGIVTLYYIFSHASRAFVSHFLVVSHKGRIQIPEISINTDHATRVQSPGWEQHVGLTLVGFSDVFFVL